MKKLNRVNIDLLDDDIIDVEYTVISSGEKFISSSAFKTAKHNQDDVIITCAEVYGTKECNFRCTTCKYGNDNIETGLLVDKVV